MSFTLANLVENYNPGDSFKVIDPLPNNRVPELTTLVYLANLQGLAANQNRYVAFICPNGNIKKYKDFVGHIDDNICFIEANKQFLFKPEPLTNAERNLLVEKKAHYTQILPHLEWIATDTETNNTIAGHNYKARFLAAKAFTELNISKLQVKAGGGTRRNRRRNRQRNYLN